MHLGATGGNLTINADTLTALEVVTITGTDSVTPMNITTGAASDIIALGTKADTLDAGAGNDIITGTGTSNTVDSGAGNDTILTLGTMLKIFLLVLVMIQLLLHQILLILISLMVVQVLIH